MPANRRWPRRGIRRKAGAIGGVVAALVVAALGFWTWYAWIRLGSRTWLFPSVSTTARMPANPNFAARTRLCSCTAARWRVATSNRKRKSGRHELVTKQQIADLVAREIQSQPTDQFEQRIPQSKIEETVAQSLEGELQLHVSGQNIWVSTPGRLTHYDWDTGKVLQEIPLANRAGNSSPATTNF